MTRGISSVPRDGDEVIRKVHGDLARTAGITRRRLYSQLDSLGDSDRADD